ncbi:MAG: translation initiation factor IF-2 subunit alpha, partial [Halobacteriaceae archaeon]
SLYDAFEQAAIQGKDALEGVDLEPDEIEAIVETARENVSVPYVPVTGYVDLTSSNSDGIDDIREALKAAEGDGEVPDEIELEVTYVGSPEYRIKVQAPDYKTAEDALEESVSRARETIEAAGGSASYHRERSESE